MIGREYHSWIEETTATNAAATATRAAPSTGQSHYVTGISGSYETAGTSGTLVLRDGVTVIGRWFVHDVFAISFPSPIKITPGALVEVELSASGTAGEDGAANIQGYTL